MFDKRMMVLPAELVVRVDENRGDVSRAEFINLLLDNQLGNGEHEQQQEQFVTWESLTEFEGGMKELLRSFLEFFITYGLEIGKSSGKPDLEALSKRLEEVPDSSVSARRRRTATD